ncbi:GNAT family N-acetyltransferase [Lentiprolixibacter aurantiacus]|uniref:GNAT family N-acetyltransferase n=1 Tax=Lentiprolixibacter aurantiacus TaxID=2993939 RepID=A0AAE3MJ56_9FLAO|nr:GNAT family N-acetyltransferase [Lentiprolixibacter aurantiacus]MCX2718399.1 GNAT family N-acetyltransferase [Lentiprolixibacter aurantiacus]
MIRKAKLPEIPEILELTRACGKEMASRGIYQWNEFYPSRTVLESDVDREELYILKDSEVLLGVIALTTIMDAEYEQVAWLTPNQDNLYVHRLAIAPNYQGQGYAQKLMTFAEDFARKGNFKSIRLDTFSQNPRNQKFYEQRGYSRLGNVYFPKQSAFPFYCYELVL